MKEALDLIKKHGATAVLLLWLYNTHQRVEQLEQKLYSCLTFSKMSDSMQHTDAVLPKKIEDEVDFN